jgi:LAS superfamily LD-carboxypeptidase LdcB
MGAIQPTKNHKLIIDEFIRYAQQHLNTVSGIVNTVSTYPPLNTPGPGIVNWSGYSVQPANPSLNGFDEVDLREGATENDDMPDTEFGETQEILGEIPQDTEVDEPQELQEENSSFFNSQPQEVEIGSVDPVSDPQVVPPQPAPVPIDTSTPVDPNSAPIAEVNSPKITKNVGATAPPIPPGLAPYAVGGKNGTIPKDRLGSIDSSYGGGILHIEAAKMYNKMIAQAKREGIKWRVSSTYRDLAGQEACYAKYGPGSAAKPGFSPHGWGLALDFGEIAGMQQTKASALGVGRATPAPARYTRENSTIYQWLAKNGPKYGWYNPYRLADGSGMDEAWHWEYWGFYTLTTEQRQS